MTKKIKMAVLMDPIQTILPKKDTTLRLMLEAQKIGFELYYLEYKDLFLSKGQCFALAKPIQVKESLTEWWSFEEAKECPINIFDVLLMRQDPPVNMNYIYTTHLLEKAEQEGVLIINRPQALRDANEKLYTTWFSEFMPESLVTANMAKLKTFAQNQEKVVFKPLHGMAGQKVFQCDRHDPNLSVVIETLTESGSELCMAQKFIKEISLGDKRILIIDGNPIPYALARIPQVGDFRGNLARGAKAMGIELTDRDRELCEGVGPELKKKGIFFAGIDVIGDYLTEINITSPTCVREIEAAFNINIAGQFFDRLLEKLNQRD